MERSNLHLNQPIGLLKISGQQAKKFLQGQITCDVEKITPTESLLGAHCNPQGRVLFLFRIFERNSDYYLIMPNEMVTFAIDSLKKYAVFFKITLTKCDYDTQAPWAAAQREWQYFNVNNGIPQIYLSTSGMFLPHELNLHLLNGISWEKGCYTGQEIIARMHYRGKLKNQLYQARIHSAGTLKRGMDLTPPEAIIVDYLQAGDNDYIILVLTNENNVPQKSFKLDPSLNEIWEWIK
jgi:tRNA-modifying protein YgfZ